MHLYLIRHADPDYPNNTITPRGHREAEALAERLAHEGVDRVFSSPLGRAIHTAQYTAQRLGLEIEIEDWAAELGMLQLPPTDPQAGLIAWDLPGHVFRDGQAWSHAGLHPRIALPEFAAEIERVGEASDRFLAGLGYTREDGVYRVTRASEQRVAMFCHGGFGLAWLSHLMAVPVSLLWAGMWLAPSSVTTIRWEHRKRGIATPRCLCIGDTGHLFAAGLPVQPRGLQLNIE